MELERVRVDLRPRRGFEAVDLGFAMARASWRPLAASWLAVCVPLGGAVVLALRDHPFWATCLLWWLRPLFARVPLHVLGQALFRDLGAGAGLRGTLRALPALARSGLGTSLFAQRLSPARTLLAPVLQLEGLRGADRRQRSAALARSELGTAWTLLVAGAHFSAVVIASGLMFAFLLAPDAIASQMESLLLRLVGLREEGAPLTLVPILYGLGISVAEPLVVAGGFGLYVSRRAELEGWDLELVFRGLARRAAGAGQAAAGRRATPRAAAAALLAALLLPATPLRAEPPCRPEEPGSAAACAEAVTSGPDFGHTREATIWAPRVPEGWELPDLPWSWLGGSLASLLRVLMWAGLAAALLALAGLLLAALEGRRRPAPADPEPAPRTLFGLDLDPAALPGDVVAAARAAFARGDAVAALSLLYRGALVDLGRRASLHVGTSATELECVRRVEASQPPPRARAFASLTDAWIGARYAGRPPDAARFEALCRAYPSAFGADA